MVVDSSSVIQANSNDPCQSAPLSVIKEEKITDELVLEFQTRQNLLIEEYAVIIQRIAYFQFLSFVLI